ncbi:MAG: PEP-CTERM sorting domain-containing protein [Bdellovibrionota bacterium]
MKKLLLLFLLVPVTANATTYQYTTLTAGGYVQVYHLPNGNFESRQLVGPVTVSVNDVNLLPNQEYNFEIEADFDTSQINTFPSNAPLSTLEHLLLKISGPIDDIDSNANYFDENTGAFSSEVVTVADWLINGVSHVETTNGKIQGTSNNGIVSLFIRSVISGGQGEVSPALPGVQILEVGIDTTLKFDGPVSSVPEPATLTLLAIGVTAARRQKRLRPVL